MSDLTQFMHILKGAEHGLEKWEKEKATCIVHLRELESDMLKGEFLPVTGTPSMFLITV